MPYILSDRQCIPSVSEGGVNTITADSNQTWTTAQFLSGQIRRTLVSTARTDTTPTAAQIVAALPGCAVGTYLPLVVVRTDSGGVNLTIGAGTNVTLTGTMTIAATTARFLMIVITTVTLGSEAVTLYSFGTGTP